MNTKVLITAIGAAGLAAGLLLAFGAVPLQIPCSPGGCGGPTINVQFGTQVDGLTLIVRDQSSCIGTCSGTVLGETVGWGDGSPNSVWTATSASSALPTGESFQHTYTKVGNYTVGFSVQVCETTVVSVSSCPAEESSLATRSVPIGGASNSSGGGVGSSSVSVEFTWTSNGTALSLTDASTTDGPLNITGITVSWGDSSSPSQFPHLGFTTTHRYSASGTYSVSEVVSWNNAGTSTESSMSANVTTGSGGSSGSSSSIHAPALNAVSLALVVGFGALMVAPWALGGRFDLMAGLVLLAFVIGASAGYLVGGL